jgi:hypothetical protein
MHSSIKKFIILIEITKFYMRDSSLRLNFLCYVVFTLKLRYTAYAIITSNNFLLMECVLVFIIHYMEKNCLSCFIMHNVVGISFFCLIKFKYDIFSEAAMHMYCLVWCIYASTVKLMMDKNGTMRAISPWDALFHFLWAILYIYILLL